MSAKIEERVEEIVRGLLTDVPELELVDVEYVRERDYYLRVYIDKAGGIDIDDCQGLSERLEEILDREDFIPEAYILEVSSPGLDRVLRKPRDFEREHGKHGGQSHAELTIALAHEEHVVLRAVVAVHVVDDPSAGQTRQIGFGRIVRHSFAPFPHDVRADPGQTFRHTHMHRRRG